MNPRVAPAVGMGLGFLGIAAWILSLPYLALKSTQPLELTLVFLLLAALILLVTASSALIINSYWTRLASAQHRLRILSALGVIGGLAAIFLAWLPWIFVPLCASSAPIAPGVCPSPPNPAEAWAALIALILTVNVSSFMLTKSYRKIAP